jgi:glycolate oxidase FAD binding subunit
MNSLRPQTIDDVQDAVRGHRRLRPIAGRTKTALSTPRPGETALDLASLSGIVDYHPDECTFTALAGTRVTEVARALEAHGQYLPFDPPFAARGATLGGTVAAGLSGAGRYRYGGVRDFLIGARFIDAQGRLVRGGAKVVKNAAGFYVHHLLVGSFGRLGVFVDLTFKVFPRPRQRATLRAEYPSVDAAVEALVRLRRSPLELEALDVDPPHALMVRVGGDASALEERINALATLLAGVVTRIEDEATVWRAIGEFDWAGELPLVKVSSTPTRLPGLERWLASSNAPHRYSVGGDICWIAWPHDFGELDARLLELGLSGLIVLGNVEEPLVGVKPDATLMERVSEALDPTGTFLSRPALI